MMKVRLKLALLGGVAAWMVMPALVLGHGNEPGVATATVGGGKVTVEYAGPQLKGRDLMAMIQPGMYWRMGADKSTTMTTDVDLTFGGKKVAKGKYTLAAHFLEEGKWSLAVVDGAVRGTSEPEGVVGEAQGTVTKLDAPVEVMNIKLEGNGSEGTLVLEWGTARLTASFSAP